MIGKHPSLENFFENVRNLQEKVFCSERGAWFRGQRKGWSLMPSLFRHPKGILREATLNAEVMIQGSDFLNEVSNPWERLVLMQHHGIPTRLLDWTEHIWVALYFAVTGETDKPRLWILNPYLLSAKSTGRKVIWGFGDDPDYNYDRYVDQWSSWPFELPAPIFSPWKNKRHRNQKGFFTLHGRKTDCLEHLCPRYVGYIEIPDPAVAAIRKELDQLHIDDYYIYQDFDSLAKTLKRKYRLDSI